MIVDLHKICKSYGEGKLRVPVLMDIDLSIKKGEYITIVGPSGSGKSTLMNIIGCLDTPTSGTYMLDGVNISDKTEDELSDIRNRMIGFVFQNFNLLPRETALDNVALPMLYANIRKSERIERARAAMAMVGLEDRTDFLPTQLSGGQKQRVAIARAMVMNPPIILADEPTGALDSASGEQVMNIFRKLNSDGVTVIMITHDQEIARHAKRKVTILDGRLYA